MENDGTDSPGVSRREILERVAAGGAGQVAGGDGSDRCTRTACSVMAVSLGTSTSQGLARSASTPAGRPAARLTAARSPPGCCRRPVAALDCCTGRTSCWFIRPGSIKGTSGMRDGMSRNGWSFRDRRGTLEPGAPPERGRRAFPTQYLTPPELGLPQKATHGARCQLVRSACSSSAARPTSV